jgi:membrane associated rhomboid family serine protease
MIPIRDTIPSRSAPVVTWSLIAINVLFFVYELGLEPAELERFVHLFGLVPARYTHPEWAAMLGFPIDDYWPFLTSMFLHAGVAHLVGNLWTLWIFGDNVEDRMGPVRFLVFYLLMGLAAGMTHWFTNLSSTIPTVGASGAIAGVLGAYFVLFPNARIVVMLPILFLPFFYELPAVAYLFVWFLSQLFGGTLAAVGPNEVAGIAWSAHVGGFVAGALLYRLFLIPPRRRPRSFARDEIGLEGAWAPWSRA